MSTPGCLILVPDRVTRFRASFRNIPFYTKDFTKYLKEILIAVGDNKTIRGFNAFNVRAEEFIAHLSTINRDRMIDHGISFRFIPVRKRGRRKNPVVQWGYTELYDRRFNTLCKSKDFAALNTFLDNFHLPDEVKIERLQTAIEALRGTPQAYKPKTIGGKKIPASANGLAPDFSRAFNRHGQLYPNVIYRDDVAQYGQVKIVLTGIRSQDFQLANAASELTKTPTGYTWHHMDDMHAVTRECTMQLVRKTIHESSTPHMGIELWSRLFGIDYK